MSSLWKVMINNCMKIQKIITKINNTNNNHKTNGNDNRMVIEFNDEQQNANRTINQIEYKSEQNLNENQQCK